MTAKQRISKLHFGYVPINPSSSTLALNAANTWIAFSFTAENTDTPVEFRFFVSAVAGSLVSTDVTVTLETDSGAGIPSDTAITNGGPNSPGSAPTAGSWVTVTFTGSALTAGSQYWGVIKNANATPASNNFTVRYGTTVIPSYTGTSSKSGWLKSSTTTGAGGWAAGAANTSGYRIGFSGGTYIGFPTSNVASGGSSVGVYGAHEAGVKVTWPANTKCNIFTLAMFLASPVGTPTGNLRFRGYKGATTTPTLQFTTNTVPNGIVKVAGWNERPNSGLADFVATGGDTWRFTMSNDTADSSSNCFNGELITFDSDSNSTPLQPFGGMSTTYTTDGVNFTDTANQAYGFEVGFDTNGEFVTQISNTITNSILGNALVLGGVNA
jgi:hypothetical protein